MMISRVRRFESDSSSSAATTSTAQRKSVPAMHPAMYPSSSSGTTNSKTSNISNTSMTDETTNSTKSCSSSNAEEEEVMIALSGGQQQEQPLQQPRRQMFSEKLQSSSSSDDWNHSTASHTSCDVSIATYDDEEFEKISPNSTATTLTITSMSMTTPSSSRRSSLDSKVEGSIATASTPLHANRFTGPQTPEYGSRGAGLPVDAALFLTPTAAGTANQQLKDAADNVCTPTLGCSSSFDGTPPMNTPDRKMARKVMYAKMIASAMISAMMEGSDFDDDDEEEDDRFYGSSSSYHNHNQSTNDTNHTNHNRQTNNGYISMAPPRLPSRPPASPRTPTRRHDDEDASSSSHSRPKSYYNDHRENSVRSCVSTELMETLKRSVLDSEEELEFHNQQDIEDDATTVQTFDVTSANSPTNSPTNNDQVPQMPLRGPPSVHNDATASLCSSNQSMRSRVYVANGNTKLSSPSWESNRSCGGTSNASSCSSFQFDQLQDFVMQRIPDEIKRKLPSSTWKQIFEVSLQDRAVRSAAKHAVDDEAKQLRQMSQTQLARKGSAAAVVTARQRFPRRASAFATMTASTSCMPMKMPSRSSEPIVLADSIPTRSLPGVPLSFSGSAEVDDDLTNDDITNDSDDMDDAEFVEYGDDHTVMSDITSPTVLPPKYQDSDDDITISTIETKKERAKSRRRQLWNAAERLEETDDDVSEAEVEELTPRRRSLTKNDDEPAETVDDQSPVPIQRKRSISQHTKDETVETNDSPVPAGRSRSASMSTVAVDIAPLIPRSWRTLEVEQDTPSAQPKRQTSLTSVSTCPSEEPQKNGGLPVIAAAPMAPGESSTHCSSTENDESYAGGKYATSESESESYNDEDDELHQTLERSDRYLGNHVVDPRTHRSRSLPNLTQPSQHNVTKRRRSICFDKVNIRYFDQVLDMNPSTSSGPSVGLGWTYFDAEPLELSQLEDRDGTPSALPRHVRENLLKDLGYTSKEIANAVRRCLKMKHQRKQTVNNLTAQKMEEVVERTSRKVKKFLNFRSGKRKPDRYSI